ncbi:pentapeptide repeat-containing protein [Pseudomonas chlororaphis]|uniref:pentapeptide repeat-containing protein n=1 Tax=Pseudomonas chlororaphis TaxID=587753 RepID=UPI003C1398A7
MSDLSDTPSLSAFKADAKRLHKDVLAACPKALDLLSRQGFSAAAQCGHQPVKLSVCQRALAASYGYEEFQALQLNEQLISKYIAYCQNRGFWSRPYSCSFSRPRHFLQVKALINALSRDIPLAETAREQGVDFAGFHFSELLFAHIATLVQTDAPLNFAGVRAPGALIEEGWLFEVENLRGANLSDAKFYSITVNPVIRPGAHCFQADFSYADLRGADFRRSYLRGSLFVGANLDGADFRNSTLYECDFTGATGKYRVEKADSRDWRVEPIGRFKIL